MSRILNFFLQVQIELGSNSTILNTVNSRQVLAQTVKLTRGQTTVFFFEIKSDIRKCQSYVNERPLNVYWKINKILALFILFRSRINHNSDNDDDGDEAVYQVAEVDCSFDVQTHLQLATGKHVLRCLASEY